MPDTWNSRARKTTDAVKRGAEATANQIHQATDFAARSDGQIADGAQAATGGVGAGLYKVGQRLALASQQASTALHSNANQGADRMRDTLTGSGSPGTARKAAGALGWLATKALSHTAGLAAGGIAVGGKAVAATGRMAEKSAPAVGGTAGGIVRGAASITSNAVDSIALPASRIEQMGFVA